MCCGTKASTAKQRATAAGMAAAGPKFCTVSVAEADGYHMGPHSSTVTCKPDSNKTFTHMARPILYRGCVALLFYHPLLCCTVVHLSCTGGQTAWHIAARDGHADVLTAMADSIKATDLSVLRSMWGTDLGETTDDILESLVQYQDTKGLSPLHLACIKGKTAAVDVLMKLGANPFAMVS